MFWFPTQTFVGHLNIKLMIKINDEFEVKPKRAFGTRVGGKEGGGRSSDVTFEFTEIQ